MQPDHTSIRADVHYVHRTSGTASVEVIGALDMEHAREVIEKHRKGLRTNGEETRETTIDIDTTSVEEDDVVAHRFTVSEADAERERIRRLEAAGQQRLEGL